MKTYDLYLFKGLNESLKQEINQYAKLVTFKKNEPLFCRDELMDYFYIIISGRVKSYQLNLNNAKEQTIFILKSGDMIDTITLLDTKPHDVIYEVLEDIQMLQIPIEKVRTWIRTNADFNKKFFPYIASQMRNIEELATDISLHTTAHRLIKLLLQNLDPTNKYKYNLLHDLSHSEIAKLIGTVRNVVERHLHQFVDEGIMEITHKHLFIKNIEKLLKKL
jgi:CRP-like cAMP-binding protein